MSLPTERIFENACYCLSQVALALLGGPISKSEALKPFYEARGCLSSLTAEERERYTNSLPQLPGYEEGSAYSMSSLFQSCVSHRLSDWEELPVEHLRWLCNNLWPVKEAAKR